MAHWASFKQTKDNGAVADLLVSTEANARKQTMLKIALLCACQDLALRGHDTSENKGEFLSLLASENPTLRCQHENTPSNAKCFQRNSE